MPASVFSAVHKTASAAAVSLCLVTTGNAGQTAVYRQNQITYIAAEQGGDGNIIISATPMAETLYHCPGAVFAENNDSIAISFVRCPINGTCDVDVAADYVADSPGMIRLTTPATQKTLLLKDQQTTLELWY